VPRINPQTMILSLLLSLWKHMVWTSSSAASLQMSTLRLLRQNALVHCEHEDDADLWSRVSWDGGFRSKYFPGLSVCCGPRGMILLCLKQVHLQNVGAAGEGSAQLSYPTGPLTVTYMLR